MNNIKNQFIISSFPFHPHFWSTINLDSSNQATQNVKRPTEQSKQPLQKLPTALKNSCPYLLFFFSMSLHIFQFLYTRFLLTLTGYMNMVTALFIGNYYRAGNQSLFCPVQSKLYFIQRVLFIGEFFIGVFLTIPFKKL